MSCKIFRDDKGEIVKVIAPNGEESRLYNDLLKMPDLDGDKNLAGELYLLAYTPSFKSYFGDFENGEIKGLVDANNEPYATTVMKYLLKEDDQSAKPSTAALPPEKEPLAENVVDAGTKAVDILQSAKAIEVFSKGEKNKWTLDRILTELQIPKEQKELLKEYEITDREQLITNMLSDYSYAIEINLAKEKKMSSNRELSTFEYNGYEYSKIGTIYQKRNLNTRKIEDSGQEEYLTAIKNSSTSEVPTQAYANLTVPGGTNYTENEIATPAITPTEKGHAQFATDQGIGWFRSDEQLNQQGLTEEQEKIERQLIQKNKFRALEGLPPLESLNKQLTSNKGNGSKTRRILEVQSDLFQNNRDKKVLTKEEIRFYDNQKLVEDKELISKLNDNYGDDDQALYLDKFYEKVDGKWYENQRRWVKENRSNDTDNKFLQLLNKANNWVTFFVKSIIQDSAKKGYEKVVFPTGATAYKIESGGDTIEDFIKNKETRLNELEQGEYYEKAFDVDGVHYRMEEESYYALDRKKNEGVLITKDEYIKNYKKLSRENPNQQVIDNEIKQLKKEIKDAKEGASGLAATARFYEETVRNILIKQYGRGNVKQVTDEYGNTWNEVKIDTKRDMGKVLFQKDTPTNVPTIELRSVTKVLDRLKQKFGVDYEFVNEPKSDWKGKYQNGKVYINSAKNITADTPFHEYLHPFVASLKKDNKALYDKLIKELQSVQEGLDEIESIKTSEGYSNLSEEEKLDEALVSYLGKLSSKSLTDTGDIVESKTERVRQSMLSQFTNWLRRTLNKLLGIKIKDLKLDYNLQDVADMVSMSDTRINLGELPIERNAQYQLDEKTRGFKERMKQLGNDIQNKVIDDLLHEAKPGEEDLGKVILEEDNHIYMHTKTGQIYKSVTTAIKGELKDPDGMFELNRLFGKHFDQTLQDIIEGKTFDQAKAGMTSIVSEEISRRAYDALQGYIIGLTADGSIVLPQVILADPESGIAGSLDIFVIKPNGDIYISDLKVSKNSYKSDKYRNKAYDVGNEAVLKGPLTTQQQHGIQVATYKRLAEVNGYPVKGISTLHLLLDVEGEGKNQKVIQFEWEGIQVHQPSANVNEVNQIVPTKGNRSKIKAFKKLLGLNNPADAEDFLTDEESLPEEDIPGDLLDKLKGTIQKYVTKLRQRQLYLENLTKSARFEAFNDESKEQAIDKISKLLTTIETTDLGRPNIAFGALLNYTKDSLTNMYKYITDPSKVGNDGYIDIVLEAEKFVESYDGLASIPELGLGSQEQYKLMRDVQSLLNAVKQEINPALEAYVKNLIQKKSNQPITEEEIDAILKEGFDISLDQFALGDLQNSKEKLLAIAANLYTEADQKSRNRTDEFITKVKTLGNKLANSLGVSKIDFSFMLNYDADGNFSGRYLQAIGQQYYDLKRKVYSLLKDENGDNLQYIPIANLEDASAEDILHNIDLQKKKEKVREFREAERLDENNQIVSGEYHRLSSEFINERAKYEVPHPDSLRKGFLNWVKKTTVSDEDYRKYKNKYYDRVEYLGAVLEKDGSYSGRTEERIGWFPKGKYVEIKELSSTGEDMRDPRYVKLNNPQNDSERAQLEFYKFFDKEMRGTLEKLPISDQQRMLGKVARVKDNYLAAAKRKGTSYFKAVTRSARDWFSIAPQMHSVQRLTDDDGIPVDNLPILYTGDARNEKKIENIKEKIKDLKAEYIVKKSIGTEEYEKELKKLNLSLAIENGKLEFNDINIDLVENLIAFRMMAEKFEQMSDIESSLLSIAKVVEKKKYYVANSLEEKFVKKGTEGEAVIKGEGDSLAYKRLKKWFKMVYYNNDEYDYSTVAQVANRIQNLTSLKGLGFNVFGGINNYVMGRINNAIEAYGGVYYDKSAYFRATGSYNKEYLPGLFKGMGSKDGVYKLDRPNSKYEALVNYFRMVRKYQADAGKVDMLSMAYIFQEGGEYNVQSKTGMAVTMSNKFELTHNQTGEKLSIYDAFNFDENTGELTLKPGYEIDEAFKTKVTNYIYEVNKQIHGNYAWEDRMVIQSHWLGQLGAQFHKFLYPAIRARFQKRYTNENLGEIEGRYRTFYNVMKHVYQTEQGFLAKATGMLGVLIPGSKAYKNMSEMEVRNMYKNIAELGFFMASFLMAELFSMLAAAIPPDDDKVKKLVNFMIYQQTRQQQEIKTYIPVLGIKEQYQLVKNPIAGLTTLRDYGEMMASIASIPFPPYDKNYYERGPHKGSLKAWKEAKDVIPALGMLNRWESFDNVRNFYIR